MVLAALLVALPACGGAAPTPPRAARKPAQGGAAPAASQGSKAKPLTNVTIEIPNKGPDFTFFFVGADLGIYKKYGINARIVPMPPPPAMAAMQKGQITFVSAIGSAMGAALQGLPTRTVFVSSDQPDFVVVGGKGIHSINQLRGKVVAGFAARNTVDEVLILLLKQDGLQPGQYHIVEAGPDASRAAMVVSGQAAATVLEISSAYPLQKKGYPIIATSKGLDYPANGLATTVSELKSHPGLVRRTVAATIDALKVTKTQESAVVPVMEKEFKMPAAEARQMFVDLQPLWITSGRASASAIPMQRELLQGGMGLKSPPSISKLFDWSFLPTAGHAAG